ncbi:Complex III assembly factor LYRM7 [Hondaea fermentalgiana]|uniref:Complex III assembly factor LYRM7 n=1 Tax=Hondaea fermentalgiana TaxID=2315210 RepID=A0A2R5GT67_9STRA|nr:Complex III assembly factor LYRM7 [Hondaea fermentalgiana]|eukprot:GBG31581.1 Complex III assembly factor LYRM7 [Hondaea fermentalgiana]
MQKAAVVQGYRRLLRARGKLFNGDSRALRESQVALRAAFEVNRHEADANRINDMIKDIGEAEDMMLHGLVQARLNERGNYEMQDVKPVDLGSGEFQPIDPAELEEQQRGDRSGIISSSKDKPSSN